MDGARSAARTIQNNLLDKDKQEAYDLLLLGTGWHSDLADRTRLFLPINYWNGKLFFPVVFLKCKVSLIVAPVPLCQSVIKRLDDFSSDETLRVAVGTYNINGGKHFRSVVYKNVSLDDWLIDPHKQNNESRLFLLIRRKSNRTFKFQPLSTLMNRARTRRIRKLTSMQLDLRRWLTLTQRTS